jgi:NAD(P)H-hydrate epimerase
MYQAPASSRLGRVQVIDIGIPREAQESVALELMTARTSKALLPPRPEDANKGTFGRLLVVGGSRNYLGAPRLVALGAYRAGAGLVTIACPEAIIPSIAPGIAEATWIPLPAGESGGVAGECASLLRRELGGYAAAVVGPGLGQAEPARAFTWASLPDLSDLSCGAVLDADALNAIALMPDAAERIPSAAVLTPHPGEMARLLGCTVAEVQADRLGASRRAAARFNCVVVLKGAHSVVHAPDGRARLSPWANPLLASAGTGDVLAGMIGAYLCQGAAPFEAACLAVYFHGAAGEALRAELGEAGLLASDIAARLPSVVRELTAG